MPIGVNEDHVELHQTIRRFAEEQLTGRARGFLDLEAEPEDETLSDLRAMELAGLHVSEDLGGGGATFLELCIVLEELGRVLAPGGFLTTSLAVGILEHAGDDAARQHFARASKVRLRPETTEKGVWRGARRHALLHGPHSLRVVGPAWYCWNSQVAKVAKVGSMKFRNRLIVVVLPAPLAPSRQKTSPG